MLLLLLFAAFTSADAGHFIHCAIFVWFRAGVLRNLIALNTLLIEVHL